ncbi:MAG: hypothetical protein LBL26_02465 [Peptococcaceae bacterium]|nr:hypothetical protein [Peptococcaceae bacterium]
MKIKKLRKNPEDPLSLLRAPVRQAIQTAYSAVNGSIATLRARLMATVNCR